MPYEPRRRGFTRLVIRMAFSSWVSLQKDEAAWPHFPAADSRGRNWSRRFPRLHVLIASDTQAERSSSPMRAASSVRIVNCGRPPTFGAAPLLGGWSWQITGILKLLASHGRQRRADHKREQQ